MAVDLLIYSCCSCACIVALLVVLCVLTAANPLIGLSAIAVVVAYVGYYLLKSIFAAEVHRADDAAWLLYQKKHDEASDLPDKLKGVFWFATNAAPELLVTFEGAYFDPERNMLKVESGGVYNWSYSTGFAGWAYWFGLRMSYIFCSELHINFEDDEYTHAKMPLYVCGCCENSCPCDGCWVPMGMWWEMTQIDDDTWDRAIYLYCMPQTKWKTGSYILKRIIDQDGEKLPAFDDMMRSLEEGEKVKGVSVKPLTQIMNGDDWRGTLCCGSEAGDESSSNEDG